MEGSKRRRRYTVFLKLCGQDWQRHITFFSQFDAENYAAMLKIGFPQVVDDYCVVETHKLIIPER